MSSRCQCPFSGAADTILGSHRDPVTCEKGWLDFAVRELSRVAAGKARGQEAVWRSQCKPTWWDSACAHPWKNPTANPKDSKDTLKAKFECLVQHLRKEGRLPSEMVEEITLWEAGRVSEVFLMTSFSSLLGQASNLHCVLGDACRKMEDTGISVAPSILSDLQNCLSACAEKLRVVRNISEQRNKTGEVTDHAGCSGRKRSLQETDGNNSVQPPSKFPKLSSPTVLSSLSVPSLISSASLTSKSSQPVSISGSISPEQQRILLAFLNENRTTAAPVVTIPASKAPSSTSQTNAGRSSRSWCTKQMGRKKMGRVPRQRSAAPTAVAVAESSSVVCLSATEHLPSENKVETVEIKDFLTLDLDNFDPDYFNSKEFDHLLEQMPTRVSENTNATNTPFSPSSASTSSVESLPEIRHHESGIVKNRQHHVQITDPLLCHTSSKNELFHSDLESEAVAGRQSDSEGETTDDFMAVLCPDAGDRALSDTEIGSDAGYYSESPSTSHRSSLDSDTCSHSDLSSPDLEAFLNSI